MWGAGCVGHGGRQARPHPGLLAADSPPEESFIKPLSQNLKQSQNISISISKYKIPKKKKDDFASKNDKFTKTHKSGVFLRTRAQWRAQQRSDFTAEASLPRAPPCSTEMENPLQRLVLKKNKYLREYKAQIGFHVHCT